MKLRPQYTLDPLNAQIWPLDQWSRKIILNLLTESGIIFDDTIPTTMGTPAIRIASNNDYFTAKKLLGEYK
jgi:hypothetical protein